MGCCQSTRRAASPSSPYSPGNTHGDSSSRAIATAASPNPDAPSPHHSPAPQRSNRRVALDEQFNAPLRPHIWVAQPQRRWTRRTIDREREEFFDTRVTGHDEIWRAIHMAIDLLAAGEIETAQGVLDAAGVTVPTGRMINGVYDAFGNYYQMPDVILSDPENIVIGDNEPKEGDDQEVGDAEDAGEEERDEEEAERRREEKGKQVLKKEDCIRVKARLSDRGGPDVVVLLSKEQSVRSLIRKIQEEAELHSKIRIAYLGKILKEGDTLVAQGWLEGHVVNALVFQ